MMKKFTFLMLMMFLGQMGFAQVDLANGLRAYYPFSGDMTDASGNYFNLSEGGGGFNTAMLSSDRFNNPNSSYFFSGETYFYTNSFPDTVLDLSVNAYTVVMWVYDGGGMYPGGLFTISSDVVDQSVVGAVRVGVNMTNYNALTSYTNMNTISPNSCLKENEESMTNIAELNSTDWFMLTTQRIEDTLNIYVDTTLVGSHIIVDSCNADQRLQHLKIGADPYSTDLFVGDIDDVMIYDRSLNKAEIDSLYNLTSTYSLPTAVKEVFANKTNFQLSPNPIRNQLSIQLHDNLEAAISVVNMNGSCIYHTQLSNSNRLELNTTDWPAGVYAIQVRTEDGQLMTKKVVKQ